MRKLTKNDKTFLIFGVDLLIFRCIEVIERDITMTSPRNRAVIKIAGRGCMAACVDTEFDARGVEEAHGTQVEGGRMMAGGGWGLAYKE